MKPNYDPVGEFVAEVRYVARLAFNAAAFLALLVACHLTACTKGPITPPPPPAPPANLGSVFGAMVEAGCIANDDADLATVQAGLLSDAQPPWFACFVEGGSPTACGGPCRDGGPGP